MYKRNIHHLSSVTLFPSINELPFVQRHRNSVTYIMQYDSGFHLGENDCVMRAKNSRYHE